MSVPKELKLKEIASRIHSHLVRFELAERNYVKENLGYDERRTHSYNYYHAGAVQSGNRVHVRYITYQHGSNLTRAEALHYLQGLDNGFEGRHWEFFRETPVPTDAEPKVRYMSLLRDRWGWILYGVQRRTPKRVYGKKIDGNGWVGAFVDRNKVFKVHATHEDLEAVLAADKILDDEKREAYRRYEETLAEIKAIPREFEPEELGDDRKLD